MAPVGSEPAALAHALIAAANSSGGWGYYPARSSRLEPTAWAVLALAQTMKHRTAHRDFLQRCLRADGWLVENAAWPVNVGFNAVVASLLLNQRDWIDRDQSIRLVATLATAKGVQVPPSPSFAQDNTLQGWSWNLETFSWVEPTAWGTFALKKAIRAGLLSKEVATPRIQEAERLLVDRCCHDGGWNFGNANVMGRDLYPHVPTTAIALLALQDRRDEWAVIRSLTFLETHWPEEESLLALGLALICLAAYDRPVTTLDDRLRAHVSSLSPQDRTNAPSTLPSGSVLGCAVALAALSVVDHETVFRL